MSTATWRTRRCPGRTGVLALLACGALYFAVTGSAQAASGTWDRAWGKDVVATGGVDFEICTVAADCKAGSVGGLGGELNGPAGAGTDAAGNVYVADTFNHRIEKFDSSGSFLRAWGKDVVSAGPGNTGTGFEICVAANGDTCKAGASGGLGGELNNPLGVVTDAAGNVYVAYGSNQRIQKFDSSGGFLRAWGRDVASAGPGDTGTGSEICVAANGDTCKAGLAGGLGGQVASPSGGATDAAGNVYVAELTNSRIQKFDSSGGFLRAWGKDVVTGGGTGFEICTVAADCKSAAPSSGLGGEFNGPSSVAVDAAGNVYVADASNNRIQKFDSSSSFLRAWGKDVASAGPGDTGTGFEVCVAANGDTCKAGTTGGLGGEFNNPAGLATDASGNVYVADFASNRIQKFADAPLARPTFTSTNPASPANDNAPKILGSAESGSTVRLYTNSSCSGSPVASGSAATFASPGIVVSVADNSTTTFYATATNAEGNTSACSTDSITYTEDSTAPATPSIDSSSPASPANDNNPELKGTAEAGATAKLYTSADCSGSVAATGSAADFASPGLTVTVADDTTTTFRATATDAAGNASPCSAAFTYVEDSTAPDTTIDSGPSGATNDSTPTFAFSSSEASASFECKLDGGSFASCSSPSTTGALTDGAHTFSVRATDQIGNTDASPASRTFTVDTQAPQTKLLKHPPKETTNRTATFKFKSSETRSTFKCKLDRKPFKPCVSPKRYRRMKPGKHVFKVRATDSAGNADRTAAKWSWTITA